MDNAIQALSAWHLRSWEEQSRLAKQFGKEAIDWLSERLRNNTLTSWGNTEDVALLIADASTKLQASIIRKCAAASAVKDLTEETFDKFVDLLELRPGKNATWIDWFDWGLRA